MCAPALILWLLLALARPAASVHAQTVPTERTCQVLAALMAGPVTAARLVMRATLGDGQHQAWAHESLRAAWDALPVDEQARRVGLVERHYAHVLALVTVGDAAVPFTASAFTDRFLRLVQAALVFPGGWGEGPLDPEAIVATADARLGACGFPPRCQLPAWAARC